MKSLKSIIIRNVIMLICCFSYLTSNAQTWTPLTTNSTSDLKAVFFIDELTGWVAGSNGEILKTTDGGQIWVLQTTGTTETIRCMHFVDANTGWAAGGQGVLFKTINGGTTWSPQSSNTPQQINSIKFLNNMEGWLVANGTVLRKTINGGSTWTSQAVTGANSSLWGLSLINNQEFWVSGSSKTLAHTTNGGSNWAVNTSLPVGPIVQFNDILFADVDNGWTTGSSGQIFHTANGSNATPTWNLQTSGSTNDLLNIEFIDANKGWVCGRNGTILSTIDGGVTWSAEASGSSKTYWDIKFVNDSTGWAVADAGFVIKYQKTTLTAPLTLLQPVGGEIYQVGTIQNIIWNSNGISNVKLEYSTNNGSSWLPITGAANIPATPNSFAWNVPNTPTLTALVRISDFSNAATNSVSPAIFYIQPVPVGKDYAVLLTATSSNLPAQITLHWNNDPNALTYTVDRKLKGDVAWTFLANVSVGANAYVDNTVNVGEAYEYRVTKTTPLTTAYGYIYAGLELPEIDSRGAILLLVDNNFSAAISTGVDQLELDLIGDGYFVNRQVVDPSIGVAAIKNIILQEYANSTVPLTTVLTIGHFPAPYSGNFAPDGHAERIGAQPADGFYGDMDDNLWTDNTVTTTTTGQIYTPNIPGDGRYDQSAFPSDIELQVGRIDMDKMSGFALSESYLLAQYLTKNHDFRFKISNPVQRGLINSTMDILLPTTSAAAWRSFSTMFDGSIKEIFPNYAGSTQFIDSLENESYLWTHMAGGGSDTSMTSDVFTSSQCINRPINTVFMQMYGSYFVEWYKGGISTTTNHLLRAPLASNGTSLATVWSGKAPFWHFHHMALGETIGYSTVVNQNNLGTYTAGSNQLQQGVHMNLMGDPTLKMHIVAPVSNLVSMPNGSNIDLTWNASLDNNIVGYNIYRADDWKGVFTKINSSYVVATSYVDNNPLYGANFYMVRAVKLENVPSGSYYNLSTGIIDSSSILLNTTKLELLNSVLIRPNPTSGAFAIQLNSSIQTSANITIYNAIGQKVYSTIVELSTGQNNFPINDANLANGCYTVAITTTTSSEKALKLVVID